MPYVMVDVEADGPVPGDYSMVSFGAVIVEPGLERSFYGQLRPVSEKFVPEALAVSGFSREETLAFEEPRNVMERFRAWLAAECKGRTLFISDNNGSIGSSSIGTSTISSAQTPSDSVRRISVHSTRACKKTPS